MATTPSTTVYPTAVSPHDGTTGCANAAIWNSYATCGTITRADIGLASPADLDNIFKTGSTEQLGVTGDRYRDMESLLVTQMELKACGGRQFGLWDWLMSSAKSMGKGITRRSVAGAGVEIEPFIMAAQKDIVKDNYWSLDRILDHNLKIEGSSNNGTTSDVSGSADATRSASGANFDPAPSSGDFILRVGVNASDGQVVVNEYFTRGASLHWFTKDSGHDSYRLEFKVKDQAECVLAGPTGFVDVLVNFVRGYSANQAAGSGADKRDITSVAFGNGTFLSKVASQGTGGQGIVTIGTNNVNDFENWCLNRPALNTNKHVPFWFQTSRYTLCVDQFYKEWLERMMRQNTYFSKFGDVSLAERNAQLGLMFQKEWCNSFFFGNPISTDQTLAAYKSLATIKAYDPATKIPAGVDYDTGMEGSAIGYRANAVGVYRQLADCGRVQDKSGSALVLKDFIEEDLFNLTRSRKDQGKPSDSIDIFTDSKTAKNIFNAMMDYYKDESQQTLNVNYDITNKNIANMGFYANSYKLHYPAGVTMNIITNEFFDDMVTASKLGEAGTASTTDGSNGRFLMVLDLGGGIYPGILGSNRVNHTTGELSELAKVNQDYACVMANPTKETTLNSLTWTAVVECPTDNLIVENFQDAAMFS